MTNMWDNLAYQKVGKECPAIINTNIKLIMSKHKTLIKKVGRARCSKCRTFRRYENPIAICWECKNRFCYDHINCLQVNSSMKENDEVRYICDKCKIEHEYRTL